MSAETRPLCCDLSSVRDQPGTRHQADHLPVRRAHDNITATNTPRITTTYTTRRDVTRVDMKVHQE